MDIFELDQREADKMAALTKGYPCAFQVWGYLYWENRDDHTIEDILPEYDQCLDAVSYTHLDVYKRQNHGSKNFKGGFR